MKTNGEEEASE